MLFRKLHIIISVVKKRRRTFQDATKIITCCTEKVTKKTASFSKQFVPVQTVLNNDFLKAVEKDRQG
jgi:hypothetical protein